MVTAAVHSPEQSEVDALGDWGEPSRQGRLLLHKAWCGWQPEDGLAALPFARGLSRDQMTFKNVPLCLEWSEL